MIRILIGPIFVLGASFHLLTLFVAVSTIFQCLKTNSFSSASAMPIIGPLLIVYGLTKISELVWVGWALLGLELLLAVISRIVIRVTNSKPRTAASA